MKNVLIIESNPVTDSFNGTLAEAYRKGALAAGADVRVIHLNEMRFDPNLSGGYRDKMELEPDLLEAQEFIKWAEHVVFVYPIWWGGPPALLKGFLDRILQPGFGFKYKKGSPLPEQLLKGRTARLITTMDGPHWYFKFIQGQPGHNMMKNSILRFCGIKPVGITAVGQVGKLSAERRQSWAGKIERLGQRLK